MIFNKRQNAIGFLFFCSIVFLPALLSAKEKQVELKWKEVPRAFGYLVEIKNEGGKTVIGQKTKTPFLNFSLSEGDYQARISSLNKFQKVAVSSKWFAIKIRISLKPVFISVSPAEFMIGPGPAEAVIRGGDFQKFCRVSFQGEGGPVEAEGTIFSSEQSLSVRINTAKFRPGYYDIIITNPGGNSTLAEKRIQFRILEESPQFVSVTPAEITISDAEAVLDISGNKFAEKCEVSLLQDGAAYKPLKTERISSKKILLTVNPSQMKEGRCGIIISNTEKLYARAENVLTFVRPATVPKSPSISSVSPGSIYREDRNIDIEIVGSDILQGATVSLMKNDTAVAAKELRVISEKEAVFTVNPSGMPDGDYSVRITHPDGASSTYRKTIEVYTEREPLGVYIGISPLINFNYVLFDWSDIIKNSFRGFDLYLGYDLPFFNSVPVIKDCGIEFNFDIVQYAGKNSDKKLVDSELTTFIYAPGVYYKNKFSLPVDFLFRIGAGLAASRLEIFDAAVEAKETYKSNDPFFYGGPSVRYSFSKYFFAEIGADYQYIFYSGDPLNTVHAFLRFGVSF